MEYQPFQLKEIKQIRPNVYFFKFQFVRDKPFEAHEQLLSSPVSYLMLRAKKDYLESTEFNPIFSDFKDQLVADEDEEEPPETRYFRFGKQKYDKSADDLYFSRKYTPYEINEELRTFKILVKMEKFGKMSKYFAHLHVSSICEFKGPFESFDYIPDKYQHYLIFTQGVGVVSAYRLVKEIAYEAADSRVLMFCCFRNINEILLRDELRNLSGHWNFKYHIFLAETENVEAIQPRRYRELIYEQRLSADMIWNILTGTNYLINSKVLLCGRSDFVEHFRNVMKDIKFKDSSEI